MLLLKRVSKEASSLEAITKRNGVYFSYGNLGDNWIPTLDKAFTIYEAAIQGAEGDERAALESEMRAKLGPAVTRLRKYVEEADKHALDRDDKSWEFIESFENRL